MFDSHAYKQKIASAGPSSCSVSEQKAGSQRNETWQRIAMRSRGIQANVVGNQPCAQCEQETGQVAANVMTKSCCGSNLRRLDHATASPAGAEQKLPAQSEEEKRNYEFHKEHQCSNQPDPNAPLKKPFTQRESSRAMFGLLNARSIVSRAYSNLGQRDPYHLKKAEKTFNQPVSFEILDGHVTRIKTALDSLSINQNLFAATCDESQCNDGTHNFVAVTLDDLSGILLCPFYFLQPGRTLATTFLHEAGHMANIDVNWAPGNEKYCRPDDVIECGNVCPLSGEKLLENVDAWMRLIYCIAMSS